jgi:phosphoserine aminotransferase
LLLFERTIEFSHRSSAGPVLPAEVKQQIADELVNFHGLGRSIMELSHRGDTVVQIADEAEATLRELLNVPDSHAILFMQGGGTAQFAAVPLNLSGHSTEKPVLAEYAVTGTWTVAAAKEASKYVQVREVLNVQKGASGRFDGVPAQSHWSAPSDDAAYLYYTDNETVCGVEFSWVPSVAGRQAELVCDMSSNFLSRAVDVSRFGVIYAGAQKNCGIAGLTIVIVKKSLLGATAATRRWCSTIRPPTRRSPCSTRRPSLLSMSPASSSSGSRRTAASTPCSAARNSAPTRSMAPSTRAAASTSRRSRRALARA